MRKVFTNFWLMKVDQILRLELMSDLFSAWIKPKWYLFVSETLKNILNIYFLAFEEISSCIGLQKFTKCYLQGPCPINLFGQTWTLCVPILQFFVFLEDIVTLGAWIQFVKCLMTFVWWNSSYQIFRCRTYCPDTYLLLLKLKLGITCDFLYANRSLILYFERSCNV